ncbi:hypothetical protein D6D18_05066 [Aureobasidium pullulans]|nr:hypothetical protein D6D18_05066 [Aureobasidium pullulans]
MSDQTHAEEGRAHGSYSTRGGSSTKPLHSQDDEKGIKHQPRNWRNFFDGDAEYNPNQEFVYPPPPERKSELQVFQNLVGIHFLREGGGLLYPAHQKVLGQQRPVSAMTDIFFASKAAHERFRNRGLYNRCLAQDQKNRVMYGLSNYVITFLYLLQILIAAAITGLSATQTGETALTVLGAINTVLAGVLAWLNGQGMPTRFRRARDQYREVVKAIEAAERTFAEINYREWEGDSRPDPFAVRDRLEQLYEDARADQESNYPDTQEGPNKNQMENTKRVMEDQIRQHQTEKNKQADELKRLQKEIQSSTDWSKEREDAIQRDFDEKEAQLRDVLAREREKVEKATEAIRNLRPEILGRLKESMTRRGGPTSAQDQTDTTTSEVAGMDGKSTPTTRGKAAPPSPSMPEEVHIAPMSLSSPSLQASGESHLQILNRRRREEEARKAEE